MINKLFEFLPRSEMFKNLDLDAMKEAILKSLNDNE